LLQKTGGKVINPSAITRGPGNSF